MTPKKKISSLRKRPEASIAEAQGKFMKPAIITAAFLSLLLVSGIAPAAAPKYRTPKTTLSHHEVLKLSNKQRVVYFKRLSRIIERIEKTNPSLSYKPRPRKSYSWLEQILGIAHAQSSELRCIYGGEPIYGSECRPLTSMQITRTQRRGDQIETINQTLQCAQGTALCSPRIYGLGATGEGLCLPPTVSMTQDCRNEAFKDSETATRTSSQVGQLIRGMPEAWEQYTQALEELCSEDFISNSNRVQNRDDLRNTCAVAANDSAEIRNIQRQAAAEGANQSAESTQATSSPAQGPDARRPRARSAQQTRPQARPPRIALDDATLARSNRSELVASQASTESDVQNEAQDNSEAASSAQVGLCQNIKLAETSRSALSDAACEACRIEVNERNATQNENFKVSNKWMALMTAASKVCDKPLSNMVQEFGYCEEKSDWQFNPNNSFFLKEIMKHSDKMRHAYQSDQVDRTFVGETHRVLRDMRSEYGFNTAFIAELFCEDKQQFKDNLNLMLQHEVALQGNPEQFQAYQSFKSCATEALGMAETTTENFTSQLQFNREQALSRYEQLSCSESDLRTDAYDKDFMKALNLLKDTKEPILVNKPGRACQVIVSEGSRNDKVMVFDGSTGKVSEVYNYKFFKDEQYSYQSLSCDPNQYTTGNPETDTRLRETVF